MITELSIPGSKPGQVNQVIHVWVKWVLPGYGSDLHSAWDQFNYLITSTKESSPEKKGIDMQIKNQKSIKIIRKSIIKLQKVM